MTVDDDGGDDVKYAGDDDEHDQIETATKAFVLSYSYFFFNNYHPLAHRPLCYGLMSRR